MVTTTAKLEIRETTTRQFAACGQILFEEHAVELGEDRLKLNWQVLRALEEGGMLVPLGLWYGHSLIGYCISILTPDIMHDGETQCQNVATFLQPEHRSSDVAKLMLDSMELVAENRGADSMLWAAPVGGALEKRLRRRDGTKPVETVFRRSLKW